MKAEKAPLRAAAHSGVLIISYYSATDQYPVENG
jgi:hypothetical protein